MLETGKIKVIINPPKSLFKDYNLINDKVFKDEISVLDFLSFSKKYLKVLKLVQLDEDILDTPLNKLCSIERIKIRLAYYLLKNTQELIIKKLFSKLTYGEQEYFKRLIRNLVNKQKIKIVLIEDDMDFIVSFVKEVILYVDKEHYKVINDFYDEELYKYVKMPKTVSLIKYLESNGYKISHEVTFNETLKAIYRGVS